jgi:hypothetical protein
VTGFEDYLSKDLSTVELCRLLGTWAAKYGVNLRTWITDGVL